MTLNYTQVRDMRAALKWNSTDRELPYMYPYQRATTGYALAQVINFMLSSTRFVPSQTPPARLLFYVASNDFKLDYALSVWPKLLNALRMPKLDDICVIRNEQELPMGADRSIGLGYARVVFMTQRTFMLLSCDTSRSIDLSGVIHALAYPKEGVTQCITLSDMYDVLPILANAVAPTTLENVKIVSDGPNISRTSFPVELPVSLFWRVAEVIQSSPHDDMQIEVIDPRSTRPDLTEAPAFLERLYPNMPKSMRVNFLRWNKALLSSRQQMQLSWAPSEDGTTTVCTDSAEYKKLLAYESDYVGDNGEPTKRGLANDYVVHLPAVLSSDTLDDMFRHCHSVCYADTRSSLPTDFADYGTDDWEVARAALAHSEHYREFNTSMRKGLEERVRAAFATIEQPKFPRQGVHVRPEAYALPRYASKL